MKGSRLFKVISILLSFMLVFSLFPVQALATVGEEGGSEPTPSPKYYTVTFVDYDGKVLDEDSVLEGLSATAPEHPDREGYTPDGWDKDFSAVKEDMTVTALYEEVKIDEGMLSPMMVAPVETNTIVINFYSKNGSVLIASYSKGGFSDADIDLLDNDSGSSLITTLRGLFGGTFVGKTSFGSNDFVNNASLKFSGDGPTYTINAYLKIDISTKYTVRYVDTSGTSIYPDYTNSSKNAGDTVTVYARDIDGYEVIPPDSQTIVLRYSGNTITFVYNRIQYTVTYDANGGTGSMTDPNSPYFSGASFTVLANGFTAPAHKMFAGWNTRSSGSGSDYDVGSSHTITRNITLYAQWEYLPYYSVTYNKNGGTGFMFDFDSPYEEGTNFTVLANTFGAPTGKQFAGWNTQANGSGTPYVAGSSYTISGNVKLYAQWSLISYSIAYTLNGGTNAPGNPTSYTSADLPLTPAAPTKTGYTFTGWSPAFLPAGSSGNKTFVANWSAPIDYTISYNLDGGANHASNPSKYNVTTPTFTLGEPTKLGYTFAGWTPSDTTIEQGSTGALTFTASWSAPVDYLITYNLDGGTNNPANPASYTVNTDTFTLGEPTKLGYTFLGWTPTDITIEKGSTGALAFTASWSDPIEYKINYNLDGGANDPANPAFYTVNTDTFTLGDPTKDGYTFLGWDPVDTTIEKGSTGELTFTASWSEPIDYAIHYNLDGGTNNPANPLTYKITTDTFTLGDPTKAGYNFLGWDPADVTIEKGTFGELTFNASWSAPIDYAIHYNLDGGTNSSANPLSYNVTSETFTLGDPTKAGYNFLGWTPADTTIEKGSTGELTFTASWSAAIVYKITYELNGGVNGAGNPTTYTVNSATINLAAPSKAGYTFTGWTPSSSIPKGSTEDKHFVATWSAPIVYNITYNLGGGVNDLTNPATYTVASPTINLAPATRLGYTFLGWNPTSVITAGSTGNKTFTARWSTAIRYNITYTMNGGTNNLLNPSGYTVNYPTITLRDPVRTGYDFAGWTPTNTIPSGSTGDKAFTANWTVKTYSITYFMQGGTNNPANPATFTVESPDITFATPTKAGYEFWFWFPSGVPAGTAMNWATIAFWKGPIDYTISYNLNGGVNAPSNPSIYNVNSATITLADPTRDGYTFAGWSPSGSIPSGSTGNQTFTASWTPVPYTISYDLAGGVNAAANPAGYTIETPTFTLGDPTRDYYTFAGWTPADTTIEQGSKGNLSFTASWTPISYSISYDLAGGVNDAANPANYTVETATFSLANPTRAGYNFTGWDPADATIEKGSHGDLTFTATWSAPIVYNITYVLGGGTNALTNPATYTVESAAITLAAPTRLGYTFTGWTPADNIPAASTGEKTFTATWSAPIVYGITYVMNGGVNAGANPATYTIESATINLAAPTRAGYNFTGWTPAGTIPAGSTGGRTFTATWSAPIVYDITYVMNGGVNAPANPATYTVVSGLITLAAPTREGYDFVRWTPTDNIPAASTGARTFTATWSQPHVHTVTYIVTGGTLAGLDGATPFAVYRDVAYGAPVPVPDDPSQDEFSFDGWTTAIPTTMPDEDVTLYGTLTRLPVLQEIITNERTPLAGPTWSLLNLILTVLTALGIGSIISMLQKKRSHKSTTKNTAFSLSTVLPAAGAIVAFVLTQILSGSMVFADRWSYLFAIITLVQSAVVALALTGKTKNV